MPDRIDSSSDLPPALSASFLAVAARRQLVSGEELFCLGSAPEAMYGVVAGKVQVSIYSEDGRRFLAGQLGAGQWFGEVPLLDRKARAFHAEALGSAEIAVLSAAAFREIVYRDPQSLLIIAQLVCSRYRNALAWIEDASLKPLAARMASLILTYADAPSDALQASQESLAAQLGVARQTVNRQLKQWERAGLLRLRYGSIQIVDRRLLQLAASGVTSPHR